MHHVHPRPALLLLLASLLLSGCVGHKKYTRILNEEIEALSVTRADPESEWLTVVLPDSLPTGLEVSVIHARFVPALLYWDWNSTLDCTLPAALLASWFAEGANAAADSLGIAAEEVTVRMEQLPGHFVFTDRGSVLVLLVAYSTSELEGIIPGDAPLRFTYTVAEEVDRAQFSTGLKPLANPGSSTRRFTRDYLMRLRRAVRESGQLWVEDRWGRK